VHAIFARKKTVQRANAIRQGGDDRGAMRDTLIARHRDFRVDPRCSLYPQFHRISDKFPRAVTIALTRGARRSASSIPRRCPAFVHSCGAIAQALDRPLRLTLDLRNEEDFFVVRVRILYFCPGRHAAHVDNFAGNIRAGDQTGFSRHRDPVGKISL
jgi:hypothetical protein